MDRKGDIPFYLVMIILILIAIVVMMGIIFLANGQMKEFLAWLSGVL